jgi:transposase-like protein
VAQRLSVPKGTIANWVAAAKHGRGPVSGAKTTQELENEIAKLRKELAEVKQEREVLKKPPRTLPRNPSKVRVHEALERCLFYQLDESGV